MCFLSSNLIFLTYLRLSLFLSKINCRILELPESIVESQETIEDTDQGVIHTVKQSTKTIIRSGKLKN